MRFFVIILACSHRVMSCQLNVGVMIMPPYYWLENGKARGFMVDVLERLSSKTQCKFTLKVRPWNRILHELQHGLIDLTVGYYMKDTVHYAHYSKQSIGSDRYQIFLKAKEPSVHSITELYLLNKKLIFLQNWHLGTLKQQIDSQPSLSMPVDTIEQCLKLLLTNRTDAFIAPKVVTLFAIKRANLAQTIQVIPRSLYSVDRYMLYSKKTVTVETHKRLDSEIQTLLDSGVMSELLDKYLR